MKKKILCLAAGLGFAATAAFAAVGATSNLIKADESDVEWRHYAAVKASETSIGSREYWVSCADHSVQFEAPTGEHDKITDATHESDYLAYLANQGGADSRYTAYVPNAFKSEGGFWRYIRHGAWGTSDYANGSVSIKSNATITYKFLQDAHELGIKYAYFHIAASEASDAPVAIAVIAQNTTGTFDGVNPWYQSGNVYGDQCGLGLILDIENWYTTFTGDRNAEVASAFTISPRNSANADPASYTLTFSDFACFDTLEAAEAYKNLTTVAETNAYSYFHHGNLPTCDGSKLVYQGTSTVITITKQLITDCKAAGKTKFSFNVKMATDVTTDDLKKAVWISNYAGGNGDSGDGIDWNTDWNVLESADLASEGVRVTLNVSKFFGDNVTFKNDLCYTLSGRLAGRDNDYSISEGVSGTVTITLSDFKFE